MMVKVCGMRSAENLRALCHEAPTSTAVPDAVGFIFHPHSPRYVSAPPAWLPPKGVRRVGVFVDAAEATIDRAIADFGLHVLQLHGKETPERCAALRERHPQLEIWKAFAADAAALRSATDYEAVAAGFVFDTPCATHGGCGQRFDWQLLDAYTGRTPFLLSGGIGPEALADLQNFTHPRWAGIDLNSRFELAPALKDCTTLHRFISSFRQL